MKSFMFGKTSQNLPIIAQNFGSKGPKVLVLGGVHGDEWEGIFATKYLQKRFIESFPYKIQLTLVPIFNFEGAILRQRKNSRQVDLNRNLPTNDWTADVKEERYYPGPSANSEPENQALVSWLEENKPRFILSLHSWNPMLNTNGRCREEAEVISSLTGYEIKDSIGYPTPGCLGTYCGLERDMPTLTYELERGMAPESIEKIHIPAILEALKLTSDKNQ